jgi:glycosyltransferase involved in cell wall biosynthesis
VNTTWRKNFVNVGLKGLKVLIIAELFPPDMGGGATRAYNMAKGLMANGCDVVVVSAFPHYPNGDISSRYRWKAFVIEEYEGIKTVRTFVPPLASVGLARRLVLFFSFMASALFAFRHVGKVDVVWAANPNVISAFPASFYGAFLRCPVVLNVDDLWPEDLQTFGLLSEKSMIFKAMKFVTKFAYYSAKLITPISPDYVKVICRKYGVSPTKVHVIRAGVDLSKFRVKASQINCGEKQFRVLYSGAFSVAYDFDQVLLAAMILQNVDGVEFVLQGGGELAGYVKSRIKELKLDNVRVIDRIVSRSEVAKLLSEADALILPLRDFGKPYLGISSKLYEYQAAGKPIICCADGQPAEHVQMTGSGLVVKPGNYEALAKAVIWLKENPKLAWEMGENGRKYVEKEASIEAIGLKMKTIFELICNR